MKAAIAAALGMILVGTLLPSPARADCGVPVQTGVPAGPGFDSGSARFVSDSSSDDPIVGFWHVTFTIFGPGLPDEGVVIDNGFAQWHSDGTEIMNSSRNPVTGNFCLGVWKRVGARRYKLNHFGISWDPTISPDAPLGPANIREEVTLSASGRTFTGTFSIDQFDQTGQLLGHVSGQVKARRITVETPASSLF
jgi:hypothetical protein